MMHYCYFCHTNSDKKCQFFSVKQETFPNNSPQFQSCVYYYMRCSCKHKFRKNKSAPFGLAPKIGANLTTLFPLKKQTNAPSEMILTHCANQFYIELRGLSWQVWEWSWSRFNLQFDFKNVRRQLKAKDGNIVFLKYSKARNGACVLSEYWVHMYVKQSFWAYSSGLKKFWIWIPSML